ncbi:MAG: helix-turn-helix transcriptional regulator [Hyphomonas sp.]|nr:helix-turn-helix transcriptional regulator [Hyphomonas sp.]
MQHGDIWRGIDLLAKHHGLSTSGLAKLAGLDATAFNKSKRLPKDGRPRWPSTESISRILTAVGADFESFAMLVSGRNAVAVSLIQQSDLENMSSPPGSHVADAQSVQSFTPPCMIDIERCFAVEIGDDELSPVYTNGDRLIASYGTDLQAGDRVIVKPQDHTALIGALRTISADQLEIDTYSNRQLFDRAALEWTARILWISQ